MTFADIKKSFDTFRLNLEIDVQFSEHDPIEGNIYFLGRDAVTHGGDWKIWKTDGTPEGTELILYPSNLAGEAQAELLKVINNTMQILTSSGTFTYIITTNHRPLTVTDAQVSITGASGTNGTYKIGDTITATWNNTSSGDNNTEAISSATVDFSAFGGGPAVAAVNTNGTWTASYKIEAGTISGSNKNVSFTVNSATNTIKTTDTTNASIDAAAPAAGVLSLGDFVDSGASATDRITNDSSFSLALSGQEAGSTITYQRSTDGGTTWSNTTTNQDKLSDGNYQFRALITDGAGNAAISNQQAVTIETTTKALKPVKIGSNFTGPANLKAIGNTLFFTAYDTTNGIELWKSDGTEAGTVLVKDISLGIQTSNPQYLTAIGSTLFFSAYDGKNGRELLKSDGTELGNLFILRQS
jgi:ELWxxDGT repeat protein